MFIQLINKTLKEYRDAIDPKGPIPLYVQIANLLEYIVDSRGLKPGDRLPGEEDVAEMLKVSRLTVNHAFKLLEGKGLVERMRRHGTIVKDQFKLPLTLVENLRFSDNPSLANLCNETKLLERSVVPAPTHVQEDLGIEPGTETIFINRLRVVEGIPIVVSYAWYALKRFPELMDIDADEFTKSDIFLLIDQHCNKKLMRGEREISSVRLPLRESKLLGVELWDLGLKMHAVTFSDNCPAESALAFYSGRHVSLKAEVIRKAD